GSGEEVSYQDFAPGATALSAANLKKLNALLTGLQERPGLQLEIEGSFDPVADGEALRRQKLEIELRRQKWAALRPSEQQNVKAEFMTLTPEERNEHLLKAYTTLLQATAATNAADRKPVNPATTRPALRPGAPEKGAMALAPGVKIPPPAVAPNEME